MTDSKWDMEELQRVPHVPAAGNLGLIGLNLQGYPLALVAFRVSIALEGNLNDGSPTSSQTKRTSRYSRKHFFDISSFFVPAQGFKMLNL